MNQWLQKGNVESLFTYALDLPSWSAGDLQRFCRLVVQGADNAKSRSTAIELLSMLRDRHFYTGDKRRATVVWVVEEMLEALFDSAPLFGEPASRFWRRVNWATRERLAATSSRRRSAGYRCAGLSARRG